LFTPLPFSPGKGGFGDLFRMHVFVNAGDLGDVYLGKRLLFSSVMNICICQFIVSFIFTGGVLVNVLYFLIDNVHLVPSYDIV
jgi:hypothetical protein